MSQNRGTPPPSKRLWFQPWFLRRCVHPSPCSQLAPAGRRRLSLSLSFRKRSGGREALKALEKATAAFRFLLLKAAVMLMVRQYTSAPLVSIVFGAEPCGKEPGVRIRKPNKGYRSTSRATNRNPKRMGERGQKGKRTLVHGISHGMYESVSCLASPKIRGGGLIKRSYT